MKQTIEIFIYNSFQQFLKIELKRLFISHNFLNSSRYLTSPYCHHPMYSYAPFGYLYVQMYSYVILIYITEHQWNTRWTFARKHDIFISENSMLSSHAKYHRCYGCIINRAFHSKNILKWNGLVFHWCLYNK